jgi:hypothetical protein
MGIQLYVRHHHHKMECEVSQTRGRPPKLDGFRVTKLKGEEFYNALGEAGFSLWPKLDYDKKTRKVVERHMLLERGAIAWITDRTERAVAGWQERKLLRPVRYIGGSPLFDIGDIAHLVLTGQFRQADEPLCREALAVRYFWTVPGVDRRENEPGSIADELDKQYHRLLAQYRDMQKAEEERVEFWRSRVA